MHEAGGVCLTISLGLLTKTLEVDLVSGCRLVEGRQSERKTVAEVGEVESGGQLQV